MRGNDGRKLDQFRRKRRTVMLLHAGVTSSLEYIKVIPFLSKNYYVIAPDFLGNGDSDPTPFAYDIIDHARSMIHFLTVSASKNSGSRAAYRW